VTVTSQPTIARRPFLQALGLGLAVSATPALAQTSGPVRRLGLLGGATAGGYARYLEAMRAGLQEHGLIEGQNLVIEYRWAEEKLDRLPALAAELVRLKVELIITQGTPAAFAAKKATQTIPIVMAIVGSPVETGVVASYGRPGINITGSSFFMDQVNAKRVELLKALNPQLARLGLLFNDRNPVMHTVRAAVEERARALKVELTTLTVHSMDELSAALGGSSKPGEALVVPDDGLFIANARLVAALAGKARLPAIGFREVCESGALLAYGADLAHIWRESATLVDKVLHGAKAADIPIQQASRFELIVNLHAAKALGVTVPQSFLSRADVVLE
jgi:putative tryptophan/tyrosine transport system substrate-binding protein